MMMLEWYNAWLPLVITNGAVVMCAVYSWHGREGAKNGAALAFLVAAVTSYYALQAPLGYPDPRTPADGAYEVLAFKGEPDVAIYVWLWNGTGAPHAYALPWSVAESDKAEKLRQQSLSAGEDGNMIIRFGGSEHTFEAVEVPEEAPKGRPN